MHISTLQLNLNAIERISDYCDTLPEEKQHQRVPPASWPSKEASIQVRNLTVTYAPHLPAALKNVTFDINAHERLGVVGRTGAGKSSLSMSFFRFLEAQQGSIIIDGQDISQLDLQSLRRSLSIVGQDPVLLNGSIRENVDPENLHDDQVVWRSLQAVGLAGKEARAARYRIGRLDDEVTQGGDNLSAGRESCLRLRRMFSKAKS